MENEHWNYKIGDGHQGLILLFILLAVFGGLSIWLHMSNNGAFIFAAFFTALILVLIAYSIYRLLVVKVLIGEDGFFHQTRPGNGKYYHYTEIAEAWESSGKTLNGTAGYYCSYKTADGQVVKFPFLPFESDGIDYLLIRINGEESKADGEDRDES